MQEAFTPQSFTSDDADAPTQKVPAIPTSQNDDTTPLAQNLASEQAMEHDTAAVYPPAATPPSSQPPRRIVRPLPLWAFILGIIVILAALGVVTFATGSDWSEGALYAGIVATSIAGVLTLLLIIRSLAGMAARSNPHRRRQYVSAILIILILFTSGGTGLFANDAMHGLQAHYLEGQKQWEGAIKEYKLAGEAGPNSSDIARTYVEWGEDLSQQKSYEKAVTTFDTVITEFSGAPNEINRAQQDETSTYITWGKQASQQHKYANAALYFKTALDLNYCSAECTAQATPLAATAYYNSAKALLTNKQYRESVTAFEVIEARFQQSPEAQQMHADMSKALLGKGKQDRDIVCENAIPTYQELAKKFADTPEGQEAKDALSGPQSVIGYFTKGVPKTSDGYKSAQAFLVQNVTRDTPGNEVLLQLLIAPWGSVSEDGHFTVKAVKQGTYNLIWGLVRPDGTPYFMTGFSRQSPNQLYYVANVGPLCPFDFGNIDQAFYTNYTN
ncbi:hypothetical protein KDW_21910 [Dictyobacter vulcani]|uniref:Tetratricopeptide repeat protein n=1 Tax=Dictyobacter vulcani TaxID=2607529 RepID=A0A5J4KPI6_9CHLR|nr:hypothetical protein KDW_21910 [Dictyobacter vulcani]